MNLHHITRRLGSLALGILLFVGLIAPQRADAKKTMGVSFQVFYDELSPYGDWVKDARYGYIWLPAVREDFHPYGSDGHWVMTEYGNTWVSNYDWGWAPFHYGRWYFDDYFQSWAWIPGYDWGPAWVNWRAGGGYYGWAPLGPGVSISVNVNIPSFHWVFIPNHHIHHHYAYRYYAPHKTKVKIYNNTTIINNTVVYNNHNYVGGPQRREVERVTRKVVPVYQVQASNAPGRAAISKNSVNIYRPEVRETRGGTTEIKPSRVLGAQETKSARSNRELNPTAPSRVSNPTKSSSGRTAESPSRATQNPTKSATSQIPERSVRPSGNEESKKPVVTPMPSQSRSTTSSPSRTQSNGSREAAPSKSPGMGQERSRTQQAAPSRGTAQQSSHTQSPARSQPVKKETSQTQQSAPSRGAAQQSRQAQSPARSQSSEVKRGEPTQKNPPASNGRTSSTSSGRSSNSDRGN